MQFLARITRKLCANQIIRPSRCYFVVARRRSATSTSAQRVLSISASLLQKFLPHILMFTGRTFEHYYLEYRPTFGTWHMAFLAFVLNVLSALLFFVPFVRCCRRRCAQLRGFFWVNLHCFCWCIECFLFKNNKAPRLHVRLTDIYAFMRQTNCPLIVNVSTQSIFYSLAPEQHKLKLAQQEVWFLSKSSKILQFVSFSRAKPRNSRFQTSRATRRTHFVACVNNTRRKSTLLISPSLSSKQKRRLQ